MPPVTFDGTNSYPTAPQIRDAYSQLPLQFGKQSFPNPKFNSNSRFKYKSKSKSRGKFPSSASGSNCTPLSTPEEVEARNQASNAWKVGRAPSKFEDVGGFRIPVQPLAENEGRGLRDNKVLAEGLKMMLEDEFGGKEIGSVDVNSEKTLSRYHYERQALSKAFQQEYSLPPTRSTQLFQESKTLPHIDRRSRTDIIAGQEVGLGVIGSTHTPLHAVTAEGKRYMAKVVEGDHGCDTPLYSFEDARRGIAIPKACLDPDLPPLAIEHPARMWNSLIHSLSPELQPVVKWTYDSSLEGGCIANMTLALPPTHPSIISHPLAMTIPKKPTSKEYISVLELLGGVKKYTGEARKFKAEAQNSALVKCIADNAISWIYAPVTKGHVDPNEDGMACGDEVIGDEQHGEERMEEEVGSDEIIIDEEISGSNETFSGLGLNTQNQEDIELESEENKKDSISEGSASQRRRGYDYMSAEKTLAHFYYHGPQSPTFSQCRTSPSVDEDVTNTHADEVVPDLEEVEYSTDNSSIIEDPKELSSTPYLDALNSLIAEVKEEGWEFDTEIKTHKMNGLSGGPEILYVAQLLISWPREQKANAVIGRFLAASESEAIESLCVFLLEDQEEIPLADLLRAQRAPVGEYDNWTDVSHELGQLIEFCFLNAFAPPEIGTCVVNGQICGHIQIGGVGMTDSKPVLKHAEYHWESENQELYQFWVDYARKILKLIGKKRIEPPY